MFTSAGLFSSNWNLSLITKTPRQIQVEEDSTEQTRDCEAAQGLASTHKSLVSIPMSPEYAVC